MPHGLDAVVQRSLAQQPEQRYQQARDVEEDLRHHDRASAPVDAASPEAVVPRGPVLAWLLVVAVFLGGFLLMARAQTGAAEREQAVMQYRAWEQRRDIARLQNEAFVESPPEQPPGMNTVAPGWILVAGALAVPVILLPLTGFMAISRIRRRRRGTRGLAFAVFTAWLVPATIAVAIPATVLAVNMRDSDSALLASTVTAVLLTIGAVVWMVWQHRRIVTALE